MKKTEGLFVSKSKFISKKNNETYFSVSGIIYDNFGIAKGTDLFCPEDVYAKFTGPGVYNITYGPKNSVLDLELVKKFDLP